LLALRSFELCRKVPAIKFLHCHVCELIEAHFKSLGRIRVMRLDLVVVEAKNVEPLLDCVL
jgi:hypothetical protein